jgi:uncharacterized protein (DUF1697 family)
MTDKYLALLRGVNVGGRNKMPMERLVSFFTDAGCKDVQTFIQSGNVLFSAESELADRISSTISESILEEFGYTIPIVTRTADELVSIVRDNPFLPDEQNIKILHVIYLADRPGVSLVAALDPDRSSPDEFHVNNREIYLRCPNGMARTKLTNAYFDSKLSTTSTTRNWRTTLKLLELIQD